MVILKHGDDAGSANGTLDRQGAPQAALGLQYDLPRAVDTLSRRQSAAVRNNHDNCDEIWLEGRMEIVTDERESMCEATKLTVPMSP